jgi:hypothetical protein
MAKYICSVCGKERDDTKNGPRFVMNFRSQKLPICKACDKKRAEDIKTKAKTSARVIIPGAKLGI